MCALRSSREGYNHPIHEMYEMHEKKRGIMLFRSLSMGADTILEIQQAF
jgi:hypothetical protein